MGNISAFRSGLDWIFRWEPYPVFSFGTRSAFCNRGNSVSSDRDQICIFRCAILKAMFGYYLLLLSWTYGYKTAAGSGIPAPHIMAIRNITEISSPNYVQTINKVSLTHQCTLMYNKITFRHPCCSCRSADSL